MNLPDGVLFLERGWLSSNGVLALGRDSAVLVDTGYATHASQTVALVANILGERQLDLVANTHLHSDHCGGNAALQLRYPDLKIFVPPGQAESVRQWDPVALSYQPTGQRCDRFVMDGVLTPGTTLKMADLAWEVHASPGHDPHSVVLFEPASRTLISADALWRNGFGVVFEELEGKSAFEEVAATFDLIEALRPATVLPGHGAAFTDVAEALRTARRRLESFRDDPAKHARHAAKVLLKFKLLECHTARKAALVRWAEETPYFGLVHTRFGSGDLGSWVAALLGNLIRAGAATEAGDLVHDA